MRNITRSLGLIIGATLLFSSCLPSEATTDNMKLWYDKPADEWMKSLPLGNVVSEQWYMVRGNGNHRPERIDHVVGGV